MKRSLLNWEMSSFRNQKYIYIQIEHRNMEEYTKLSMLEIIVCRVTLLD